ncbi:ATP-binding protein [Loktanella salsilacus]|uniref:ATP-binding protein n=1 Tax=Loktanella salsilacus TaxID=195913 RepID=UPI0020B7C2D8|nr:ATP-binding protein [Loktanella salsilacus]UTH48789.1 ATP-binding protein [Loktanella salsilacus]
MIEIGQVTAVVGVEITIKANDNSNLETHFYHGQSYKGVSIREFIAIDHGFREVICIVEGEILDERWKEGEGPNFQYVRKLKARPIGYFEDGKFQDGIKFLPKIGDPAKLMPAKQVEKIFEKKSLDSFVIGSLLKEDLPISLPWRDIFNTHIGIFGNTGSGKSNTLAKLFTTLFDTKIEGMINKSKFIFLDFNGEYTGEQLAQEQFKEVIKLSTRRSKADRFAISNQEFWDAETLGILFQATANTQKPFLKRVVSGRNRFKEIDNSLARYLRATFELVLKSKSPSLEALEQLKYLARFLDDEGDLTEALDGVGLRRGPDVDSFHYIENGTWKFLSQEGESKFCKKRFLDYVDDLDAGTLDGFDELQVRSNLQIIRDVLGGSAQYDHIQPLLRRMEAIKEDLKKVISVSDDQAETTKPLTVISLREVKQEIKKIIPILVAKQYFEHQKETSTSPPTTTVHLVIDEAHNILSTQSSREAESWKDYRLELFEEIIKEGRKFGVFLTLASQRPSDISPTIVSQIHNYFIHRLVNDRDLALLDSTISTLDSVSKSQIPSLPKGACVVTGTTFDIPMLLQIDKLEVDREPDSRDVDLTELWGGVDDII